MGDMAEGFKEMREAGLAKRAGNREVSAGYLEKHDIPFAIKNYGAHLIVEGPEDCFVDFWPGTGRWISRNGVKGFGVRNLVEYITQNASSAEAGSAEH